MGVQLEESKLILPGGLDSHEIEESNHPLLLSQAFQAMLGFTKNARHGTITLDDYNKQNLEVVRQVKTGLFMIRVDHLLTAMFRGSDFCPELKALLFEEPQVLNTS